MINFARVVPSEFIWGPLPRMDVPTPWKVRTVVIKFFPIAPLVGSNKSRYSRHWHEWRVSSDRPELVEQFCTTLARVSDQFLAADRTETSIWMDTARSFPPDQCLRVTVTFGKKKNLGLGWFCKDYIDLQPSKSFLPAHCALTHNTGERLHKVRYEPWKSQLFLYLPCGKHHLNFMF
jgi:hypothetical protein